MMNSDPIPVEEYNDLADRLVRCQERKRELIEEHAELAYHARRLAKYSMSATKVPASRARALKSAQRIREMTDDKDETHPGAR